MYNNNLSTFSTV